MDKLKAFKEQYIKYNMMDAMMIPEYHDRMVEHREHKCGGPETMKFLLDH